MKCGAGRTVFTVDDVVARVFLKKIGFKLNLKSKVLHSKKEKAVCAAGVPAVTNCSKVVDSSELA